MSSVVTPDTPTARRARIARILSRQSIGSQEQLREALAAEGLVVTQATLSRDLADLGAIKAPGPDGRTCYVVADELDSAGLSGDQRLGRVLADVLVGADHSGNIVVLRTPPGAAQYLASAIDHSGWEQILGTVAGDDTVMIVSKDTDGGESLADRLLALAQKG